MDAITQATTPFSDVLDQLTRFEDTFRAEASENWRQGRTLFGGLSAALAVVAAQRAFSDLPPLKSAQFAFTGPATGAVELEPKLLRSGKSSAFVEVSMQSEGEAAMRALLLFAHPRRSSHSYRSAPLPDVSPPGALPEFFDAPFAPRFTSQFDARFAGGARAVSGAEKPELLLWLRHRDPAAPNHIASVIALGDVPPPAAMTMFTTPAPVSTVTWSLDVVGDRLIGPGWHLIHVQTDTIDAGYSSQRMTLWDSHGAPVLFARQNVAIFA